MKPVWIVDDDRSIRWVIEKALSREGIAFSSFSSAQEALDALSGSTPEVLVSDVRMPGLSGLELLQTVKQRHPAVPVIVMTAYSDLDSAVAAFQGGAYEYLPKPFDVDQAVELIRRALDESRRELEAAEPLPQAPEMLGHAPAMQEVFRAIGRLSQSSVTVLITGESGTGKELVARALHRHSARASKPFIAINTAAMPKDLLESELFGHERGSFTGAQQQRRGRFEQAEGGTLFLDEIGDMPMEAQTRLLRVLQQGEYTTVGGRTPIKSDVRIIAATNKDLRILIQQGLFREDLFFRLNVVPLRLPPLRERVEDIPDLIRHFFSLAEREGLPQKQIDQAALDRMKRYRWPGNVRELENLARRLAALYPQETITAAVIDTELAQPAAATSEKAVIEDTLSAAVERNLARYFGSFDNGLPPPGLYHRILREVEYPLLSAALAATRGNQIRAAQLLGLNRNTLRKKIKDLGLEVIRGLRSE